MNAFDRENRPSLHPREGLQSPFLDQEIFAGQGEEEWEPRLSALEASSPFTGAFELPGAGSAPPGGRREDEYTVGEESDALDEGEIIGTDDRVHVTDTRVVPNRWICAIDVKAKEAAGARGSGVLVGPRHVLTAAHVMRAGDVRDAKFSPARNGDNTSHPFGRFGLKRVRYASAYWVERQRVVNGKVIREQVERRDDYALVTLDRDLPAQLGFWGQDPAQAQLRALTTAALDGSEVTVTGYPGDRCGTTPITGNQEQKARRMGECRSRRPDEWASTQWRASGTAHAFDMTPLVFYGADTYGGQSGGPVSLVIGGVHVCAGIHVNGDTVQNWGVRVTPRMLGDLRAWINADAGAEIAGIAGDALVFGAGAQREGAGGHFSEDEIESLSASPNDEAESWATETYPEQELQDEYHFRSPAEFTDAGYEVEQYAQPDEFQRHREEYTGDYETEDAAVEGETFADAEEYGDESELFEELVPLTLPAATPKLPSDAAMRSQLQAMGTAEARALDQAFASFGNFGKFVNRLPTALNAVYKPLGGLPDKHMVHVARLGAESFIYGAPRLEGNRYYPWVDYPDINQAAESSKLLANFLHFSMRRLHQISRIATRPETHRRQMDRAGVLFRFFHTELASGLRRTGMEESLLLDYRTLLVQITWLHYQRLLDGWLATAAKSRLSDKVIGTEWVDILRLAAITQVDDARALVPTFNLTAKLYRDYFDQNAASDIAYLHYTSTPPPFTGHGPDMSFTTVFRRRVEQKALIEDLRKESGSAPLPNLHDSASWQAWARNLWDKPQLRRETKLTLILGLVGRYFNAFTVHTPHDLREGCSEKNYLTRVFPRAVTGSLVHDCFVYACRWLHILGRLLTSGSTSEGIAKARIFLIEMPAHVGVMIRGETTFNRHVLVSINNKDAQVHEIDAAETDEAGARIVVQDMYHGMKTAFVMKRVTSKPADAKALWSELCKLADKKLTLPYKDPKDPHLRYLKHNALVARIGREFTNAVRASWTTLRQSLEGAKSGGGQASADLVRNEIRKHAAKFETAIKSATEKIDSETKPLIKEINPDLDAHKSRIPKGVLIVETAPKALFANEVEAYRNALKKAVQTGDVSSINPNLFFPDNDFAAEVE